MFFCTISLRFRYFDRNQPKTTMSPTSRTLRMMIASSTLLVSTVSWRVIFLTIVAPKPAQSRMKMSQTRIMKVAQNHGIFVLLMHLRTSPLEMWIWSPYQSLESLRPTKSQEQPPHQINGGNQSPRVVPSPISNLVTLRVRY